MLKSQSKRSKLNSDPSVKNQRQAGRAQHSLQTPPREASSTFSPRFHVPLLVRVELPDVHQHLPLKAGHSDVAQLPNLQEHRASIEPCSTMSCSAAHGVAHNTRGAAGEQQASQEANSATEEVKARPVPRKEDMKRSTKRKGAVPSIPGTCPLLRCPVPGALLPLSKAWPPFWDASLTSKAFLSSFSGERDHHFQLHGLKAAGLP